VALDEAGAIEAANYLLGIQDKERFELDVLRRYATGKQALPLVIPTDAPREVREMARISRINLISIVINSLVESLYVDNLRVTVDMAADGQPSEPEQITAPIWKTWQANKLDRGQSGLYRAVFQYGYAYMVITAGTPAPVIRPMSPRRMTALYSDDADWPDLALERRRKPNAFRLYDDERVYILGYDPERKRFALLDQAEHGSPYCPVVRYRDVEDLDLDDEPVSHLVQSFGTRGDNMTDMVAGQVAGLMTLQDQSDVTTFALKSAEWYSAFRQRWVVGWTPASATDKVKSAASQLWTFDNDPDEVKLGEFSQTMLDGYLASRDSVAKFAATLSQTPVHELIGELVNLSAEALAAAEAGRDRKIDERKTGLGESHEQLAQAAGLLQGVDVPDDLEVVWRDTSARAFGAIVDGLGKLAAQLQIPPEALWERIPGATLQDVRRWKTMRAEGDSMSALTDLLDRQAAPPADDPDQRPSGIVVARPGQVR
jgi:SPP1 Gp6-like portal protein